MDLPAIRRAIVSAMFSDDRLLTTLVLKGGNALSLVHGIGARSSLDVDLSIESDFEDFAEIGQRLTRVVRDRLDSAGYLVFDANFERRPPDEIDARWGGYRLTFKLIEKGRYEEGGLAKMRREAVLTGRGQERVFTVEISKGEYCRGKQEALLDDYTVYVYTPEMIAVEKVRAICQQMPEYTKRRNKTARSRDFYDITMILGERETSFDAEPSRSLFAPVFAAKDVPLSLIAHIPRERKFHRQDWADVTQYIVGDLRPFDFYFDFVCAETGKLEALWME
jgi:hypothetical protein